MSRTGRVAVGSLAGVALSFGFLGGSIPASADVGCPRYATYSALADAAAVMTLQSFPGITIVSSADVEVPGAQASLDSVTGSTGWAGVPYSETVSSNLGAAALTPGDVPVFAVSAYPAQPSTIKSLGIATLTTESSAQASEGRVTLGAPATSEVPANSVSSSANVSCAGDGTLTSVANETIEGLDIAGLLNIGSVVSNAEVVVDPDGKHHVSGTMQVQGATVLGQPIAITSRGVVVGPADIPLPVDPLAALAADGIVIKYITAVTETAQGQALAPGLEITISHQFPGLGSGPISSTYIVGEAFALATTTPAPTISLLTPPTVTVPSASGPLPLPALAPGVIAAGGGGVSGAGPSAPPLGQQGAPPSAAYGLRSASRVTERIASWSIAPAYTVLALGALVLLVGQFLFRKLAARFQWT